MSKKSGKIAELIAACHGQRADPHYVGYFKCFNAGLYYEAHDVLEEMWLPCRKTPGGNFYKGLIQFAGAFVHLQKNRLKPAAALFNLAASYLKPFEPVHERLDVTGILRLIEEWQGRLRGGRFDVNPLQTHEAPHLSLGD